MEFDPDLTAERYDLMLPPFSRLHKMVARARNVWPWDSFFFKNVDQSTEWSVGSYPLHV